MSGRTRARAHTCARRAHTRTHVHTARAYAPIQKDTKLLEHLQERVVSITQKAAGYAEQTI